MKEYIYSKGTWKVLPHVGNNPIEIKDPSGRPIAMVRGTYFESELNARLIVATVNACAEVNPDNPMTVAESVKDMYEALSSVKRWLDNPERRIEEITPAILKTLDKVEGKEIPK